MINVDHYDELRTSLRGIATYLSEHPSKLIGRCSVCERFGPLTELSEELEAVDTCPFCAVALGIDVSFEDETGVEVRF